MCGGHPGTVTGLLFGPTLGNVPLILLRWAGYPGIGRYDGPHPEFPEDPFHDFIEPYKSMSRRGRYEPLLVHAGTQDDITVGEAKGMVKWVELYRSFNRANTERMETALHGALHEEVPLGVLLTPFILFLMVFNNEGHVNDNPGVVFNPPVKQAYGL
ncbi:hypothetical protein JKP88DRAFT_346738 [Tribonema minus]|uniref:Uncharacterized protein n=1 Tax=Tribonema minus TaxID=303371 RepID=A0A835YU27_9STRA|nr:hypothetical protein JKP88DRAFT_346738 [Tribonema minus]